MEEHDLYSGDPATTVNRVLKVLSELASKDEKIVQCIRALSQSEVDLEEKEELRRELLEKLLALDEAE
ncbi:hypothetical protein [Endozoicomonas sp. 2B-B]